MRVYVIYQPDNYGLYLHKSAAKVAPVSSSRSATQAGTDQKFRNYKSISEFSDGKKHPMNDETERQMKSS